MTLWIKIPRMKLCLYVNKRLEESLSVETDGPSD